MYDLNEMDSQRVATAALERYFRLTESWGLTDRQQRTLLGEPAESTFFKWKSMKTAKQLDSDVLERISYVLGIHKALRTLLPTKRAAYEWVSKPNNAPLFHGKTALSRMLIGRVSDLYVVRKYLDEELG